MLARRWHGQGAQWAFAHLDEEGQQRGNRMRAVLLIIVHPALQVCRGNSGSVCSMGHTMDTIVLRAGSALWQCFQNTLASAGIAPPWCCTTSAQAGETYVHGGFADCASTKRCVEEAPKHRARLLHAPRMLTSSGSAVRLREPLAVLLATAFCACITGTVQRFASSTALSDRPCDTRHRILRVCCADLGSLLPRSWPDAGL